MRRERDEKETGMGVGRGLRKGGRCCDRLAGLAGRAQGRVVGGGGTCARVRAVGGGGTASMGSGCGRRRAERKPFFGTPVAAKPDARARVPEEWRCDRATAQGACQKRISEAGGAAGRVGGGEAEWV